MDEEEQPNYQGVEDPQGILKLTVEDDESSEHDHDREATTLPDLRRKQYAGKKCATEMGQRETHDDQTLHKNEEKKNVIGQAREVFYVIKPKPSILQSYEGEDLGEISERYRRNSIDNKLHFLGIKTIHKHERSSRRVRNSFSKASNTIEKIDDEIDAVSSASSRYRDAVKAIDDACYERAAEENL